MTFPFNECLVFRSILRYIVHVLHRFLLQSARARSKCHVVKRTRNSLMETKVPDFVSTMLRTIKCNHCSKLFVNQQVLFFILFTDVSTHKIISILFKISASALF